MEQLPNCEVVTLDTTARPQHKLAQIITLSLLLAFVLALAIPQAEQRALPTPGDEVRAVICGTQP